MKFNRKLTRRQFLKGSMMAGAYLAAGGTGALFNPRKAYAFYQSPNLQKFIQPLRNPLTGGIPVAASDGVSALGATHYTIDIGQYTDQLHPNLGPTTLRGYGQGGNFTHLGGIIVAKRAEPVQITFQNNLPAGQHIIPVDTTIPGAGINELQNRTATHLHGGLVPWISDGGPFDWWAPDGSHGDSFLNNTVLAPGNVGTNKAEYYYPNNQSARLVWYHDHAFGITRINAYAGIASGYIIYDDYETVDLAKPPFNLPGPKDPRTFYLIFQDKIFVDDATIDSVDPTWKGLKSNGSLWYAHTYDPNRWSLGTTRPDGYPPDPSVIPEFFGDTILVNGTVYPFLELEPRQYRFRLLNACNARFINPKLMFAKSNDDNSAASTESNPLKPGPAFVQIGTEGGFLPYPAMLNGTGQPRLLLAPAERADLIIDLRGVSAGSRLILESNAPAPYPAGDPINDYYPGNSATPSARTGFGPNTRTLLQIRVKKLTGAADASITFPPTELLTPTDPFLVAQTPGTPIVPTPGGKVTLADGSQVTPNYRYLTLNEDFDSRGRLIQFLGTNLAPTPGAGFGRAYTDQPTEYANNGDYEIWEIANLTGDTHPIHFHLVNVQVLSRQRFNAAGFTGTPAYIGVPFAPDKNELGWKETVRMNPGQVTRVFMKLDLGSPMPFDVPTSDRIDKALSNLGLKYNKSHEYVWHCHILEHEEHDMMRPLVVLE